MSGCHRPSNLRLARRALPPVSLVASIPYLVRDVDEVIFAASSNCPRFPVMAWGRLIGDGQLLPLTESSMTDQARQLRALVSGECAWIGELAQGMVQHDDVFWHDHEQRRVEQGVSMPQYCAANGLALSTYRHRVNGKPRSSARARRLRARRHRLHDRRHSCPCRLPALRLLRSWRSRWRTWHRVCAAR